jgi:hypothetical protein
MAPAMMKAVSQSYLRIDHAISGGAMMAPTDAPRLNVPAAKPRSRAGNQYAVARMPAGINAPSTSPSKPRRMNRPIQPFTNPCAMQISDHATPHSRKPKRRPMRSIR